VIYEKAGAMKSKINLEIRWSYRKQFWCVAAMHPRDA
jgi:hypothetical protein